MARFMTADRFDARGIAYYQRESVEFESDSEFNDRSIFSRMSTKLKDRMQSIHKRTRESHGYRRAVGALRQAKHRNDSDVVKQVTGISEFQNAKVRMQNIIMSNPVVRLAALAKRLEGYDGYEINDSHVPVGHNPAYRNIMSGQYDKDTKMYTTYFGNDKQTLSREELGDVMITWHNAEEFIKANGDDLTSKNNASM